MGEHSSAPNREALPGEATRAQALVPRSHKAVIYVCSALLCGLTLYPAFAAKPHDSFPFSNYPMFAQRRGSPTFHKLEIVREDGTTAPVPPQWVGSGEVLQAKAVISRAVLRRRRGMRKLCQKVSQRAAAEGKPAAEFRFRELRYDPIAYFNDGKPLSDRTLYRCDSGGNPL